uniref:Uncharacterized protein n=1 Tax=candidate division WOR-3 bacterium TaxID=2052148 RepID=A0A7C4TD03_UNCW3
MKFWEYLLKIDRRVVFLVVGLSVLIPLIFPFYIKTNVMPTTQKLFDTIEEIDPGAQGILIAADYDPQTMPELQPMFIVLLRHSFARRIPVLVMSSYMQGIGLAKQGLDQVAEEFNSRAKTNADSIIYGRDYVFLGFPPLWLAAVLRMGSDISQAFPADYYKNRTASLEMMKRIKNYNDIGIVVSIAGSGIPQSWVTYANTRFGVKVGSGATAVMAPDFYPFLQTGQMSGMIAGLKGASEYEYLVNTKYNLPGPTPATKGMGSQSIAHLTILLLVVIGNIGYFASRRRR